MLPQAGTTKSQRKPELTAKPRPMPGVEKDMEKVSRTLTAVSDMGSKVAILHGSRQSSLKRVFVCLLFALAAVNCAYSQRFDPRTAVVRGGRPIVHQQGYIFLDGRYIPPPYEVEVQGENVSLNGLMLTDIDLSNYEIAPPKSPNRGNFMFGRRRFTRDSQRPGRTQAREFAGVLIVAQMGTAVVLFKNRPPLAMEMSREGQDLINTLCDPKSIQDGNHGIPETLTAEVDRETWTQLVSEFQPTTEFLARATEQIRQQEQIQAVNEATTYANVFAGRIEYPVTIFAMIVVVLSFGHLLSNKPVIEIPSDGKPDSMHAQRIVGRSLLIVGILSALDLAWTIAASQSGTMRELNPLGSQLIDNPLQLVIFKLAASSTAIGLLYWLHRQPIAQVASWWSCLVLTLLTARWLTLHSMFL